MSAVWVGGRKLEVERELFESRPSWLEYALSRMLRSFVFPLVLAACASGCDRSFPARVGGRIVFETAPRPAWVIALGTDSATELDATGHFEATYARLNVHPSSIPLLVLPRSGRPFVLQPERDFSLTRQSGEWIGTIDLDAKNAKPAHMLTVTCSGAECTAIVPREARSCFTNLVALRQHGSSVPVGRYTETPAGTEISFTSGPDPVVVASVCAPGADDFVSDVVTATVTSNAAPADTSRARPNP